jgi:hypothetical protein
MNNKAFDINHLRIFVRRNEKPRETIRGKIHGSFFFRFSRLAWQIISCKWGGKRLGRFLWRFCAAALAATSRHLAHFFLPGTSSFPQSQ